MLLNVHKRNGYTVAQNEWIHDTDLSAKAKGIMIYLVSLPNDWKLYMRELVTHFTDGIDAIRNGINELIKAGYIIRGERFRDENGRYKEYIYHVYESRQEPTSADTSSKSGKPNVGKSKVGKSKPTNKELKINTNKTKKTTTIKKAKTVVVDSIPKEVIQEYKGKINTAINDEVSEKAVNELIQAHGVEKINKYLDNWKCFDVSQIKSNSAFFISAVKDGYAIPAQKYTNDNRNNFKMRDYNFDNSIYANCKQ